MIQSHVSLSDSNDLKTICFVHAGKSRLPDIQAYADYFAGRYRIVEEHTTQNLASYDILWFFMGWFRYTAQPEQYVVHEYSSLSVPPFSRLKDRIKLITETKPDLRVFQNRQQLAGLNFKDKIPLVFRDMGVADFFRQTKQLAKLYDVVYVGAMDSSRQLHKALDKLLLLKPDLRVLMVGQASDYLVQRYSTYPHIQFCGVVDYSEIPSLINKATFGLNYIPDRYPYNIQSSTKLLEYFALGLPVIGNMSLWSKDFIAQNAVTYFDLENLTSWPDHSFEIRHGKAEASDDLLWHNRILKAGFEKYLPKPF